ncbi:MAG: metal-dependent transcriptional regulator [Ruminococcaceae bacterium]|nr:metal-dependent transcriptional regulator [Oscillospiraceae bacterium]
MRESREMYLETIYVLTQKLDCVHAIDVCQHMGFSKPSVSRAVGLLKKEGLIYTEKDSSLHLTEEGQKKAEKIYERHTTLTSFLIKIGVSPETASEDACRIEHHISDETLEAIKNQIK